MGIGAEIKNFDGNLYFFQIVILLWFLYHTIDSGQTKWKRRSRPFRICVTHRGGELFFYRYRLSKLVELDFQYSVICDIFCSFFKFSLHINPDALKQIEYQNNPNINPGYSFHAPKMLQHWELEKWTNHNFVLIFLQSTQNWL